jgi:hypothetical protein
VNPELTIFWFLPASLVWEYLCVSAERRDFYLFIPLCPSRDRQNNDGNKTTQFNISLPPLHLYYILPLNRVTNRVDSFVTLCHAQFNNATNSTNNKQLAQWCDGKSGLCMAINIPTTSSTDYYLAITAPQNIGYPHIPSNPSC